jgi:sialate O-acetylesterase
MLKNQPRLLAVLSALMVTAVAPGSVKVSPLFGNHMVLQRDMQDPIWGAADPGETITVRFAGQRVTAVADSRGRWMARLSPLHADAKPRTLVVTGKKARIRLTDVLVGDVWLCSGQSNMEYPLHGWFRGGNARHAVAHANYPLIRMINLPSVDHDFPHHNFPILNRIIGRWNVCTPATAASFSAVGYFFGRDLQKHIHVPIGLIQSAWGGTRIQPWLPAAAYRHTPSLRADWRWLKKARAAYPRYQQELAAWARRLPQWLATVRAATAEHRPIPRPPSPPKDPISFSKQNPTVIFNGRIAPLIPLALRGILWYQGENNVGNSSTFYYDHLAAMIQWWRAEWNRPHLPFLLVQIAPFDYAQYSGHHRLEPEIWQAQEWAAERIPDCGIVSTQDADSPDQGHPVNKRPEGYRLSELALEMVYHVKGIHARSPMFKSMTVRGSTVIIRFSHTDGGLVSRNGKPLNWFEIADRYGKFVPAEAVIRGNRVLVHANGITRPTRVRFGWYDTAMPNLMSKDGLPVMPFEESVSGH